VPLFLSNITTHGPHCLEFQQVVHLSLSAVRLSDGSKIYHVLGQPLDLESTGDVNFGTHLTHSLLLPAVTTTLQQFLVDIAESEIAFLLDSYSNYKGSTITT
jgi:hypothetical protein